MRSNLEVTSTRTQITGNTLQSQLSRCLEKKLDFVALCSSKLIYIYVEWLVKSVEDACFRHQLRIATDLYLELAHANVCSDRLNLTMCLYSFVRI